MRDRLPNPNEVQKWMALILGVNVLVVILFGPWWGMQITALFFAMSWLYGREG